MAWAAGAAEPRRSLLPASYAGVMPRTSSTPGHPLKVAAGQFSPADWRLVVTLPAEVMIATVATQAEGERRSVAEGLAGLDAIAAGRGSDSDLVRAVVAAIYSEPEEDRAEPPADAGDLATRRAQVLAACGQVVAILRAHADPADAAAYRHWVLQVAVRVCAASQSGGVLGLGGDRIAGEYRGPGRDFLDDLAVALG